ncbi:MAG: nucleotidyltransferase family protein [Terracidiphilus sp.]
MKSSVAAIVLAAGASRRLGQPKQLLMHGDETMLARSIRLANEAGAGPVIVVLGAHHERIRDVVAPDSAIVVINEKWEQGIASSIHAGVNAIEAAAPAASGALILSCDQPRLTAAHMRTLIESFTAQNEPSIVASVYAGIHGVPAVFPRFAFPHLLALSGDKGARALLKHPPCPLIVLPFEGGEVDIDRPGDLAELE